MLNFGGQNNISAGQLQQWPPAQQWPYSAPPEPKWPNQMCELLAEAGRLLLEENNRLKARVAELEALQNMAKSSVDDE